MNIIQFISHNSGYEKDFLSSHAFSLYGHNSLALGPEPLTQGLLISQFSKELHGHQTHAFSVAQ